MNLAVLFSPEGSLFMIPESFPALHVCFCPSFHRHDANLLKNNAAPRPSCRNRNNQLYFGRSFHRPFDKRPRRIVVSPMRAFCHLRVNTSLCWIPTKRHYNKYRFVETYSSRLLWKREMGWCLSWRLAAGEGHSRHKPNTYERATETERF